ncbi:related to extracellular chitinase [Rhynchosporium secalis]|uniref:chitinase n=1 Tax=Rhynchosporium secalis TaxID=38038 RepID=A0A1E1MB96_RHYSE|nr:related to extracellular chitinase [Rhynchosporium secalis]
MASLTNARYIMYLTGQHNNVPKPDMVSNITHVAIAFMQSATFNEENPTQWPFFTTVEEVRSKFARGTTIMVAFGGWSDPGFSKAAKTESSRKLFARNAKAMVDFTGADGVDMDWEYPGGNGEGYKQVPNSKKEWEITAYPLLLAEIRAALGPSKVISAAVPGLRRDMLAFTKTTVPLISNSVDFLNIMTYDLMNRRDTVTKHHTGIELSLDAINAYLENGLAPEKANLGFAFYVKWFKTDPNGNCSANVPVCKTVLMEDPKTGADLGQAGAFSWIDDVPAEFQNSFSKVLRDGTYDEEHGGHCYWDENENIWWTWDTPDAILKKFPAIVDKKKLGGVFAWGLGEDSKDWSHLKALTAGVKKSLSDIPLYRDEL